MKKSIILFVAGAMLCSCTKTAKIDHSLPTYEINLNEERQTLDGIGGALTESSAYVLACVSEDEREAIIEDLFSVEGANFSIARTHIGACDFSVEGKYSLMPVAGDTLLRSFSLDEDKKGFAKTKYPDIVDEEYDLYDLMKDAAEVKENQQDKAYNIIATTWTAPAWMKDNGMYYDKQKRTGGRLLKKYYGLYADYLVRYVQAYAEEGIKIWAVSPVNEPMGNDGSWESMHFTPEEEAEFIGRYLGPKLEAAGLGDVKILGFDQNTFEAAPWSAALYGDSLSAKYTYGLALHWYGSTYTSFPEVMDSLHRAHPDKALIHTEACIDNLGCEPWSGVSDPAGFKESGWFGNDSFWWTPVCTDWAYSTPFWPELHPAYIAVHRYARYIIEGFNNWMTGFTDWNIVLDSQGGPNHVGNFCGAPVMIDTKTKEVYYTPVYDVLALLSRAFRPGDKVLYVTQDEANADKIFVCAAKDQKTGYLKVAALNTTGEAVKFNLKIEGKWVEVSLSPYGVKTLQLR